MLYIPNKDRDDYQPPTGYISLNCSHNIHTNLLDTFSHLLHRHVEEHGPYDNNIPPLLVPQCPPNLGRSVPNFVKTANSIKLGKCLCERIRPRQEHLHNLETPPTRDGRTRHFYTTDPAVIRRIFPKLSALAQLPISHVPNDPAKQGDKMDLLNRTIAKLEEWAIAIAPEADTDFVDWILPFRKAAEDIIGKGHHTKPRFTDGLVEGWEDELAKAYSEGLVLSKPDKLKGWAFMCSHLPHPLLKQFMENPDRYEKVMDSPKEIRAKNLKAFKRIGCTTEQYERLACLIPMMKTHKLKIDWLFPYSEHKLRPATNYRDRGNAHQQRQLAAVLRVVEVFHCGAPDSHLVTNSVDFHLKLQPGFDTMGSSDCVGMFDNLNLEYAAKAIKQLVRECFEDKQRTHGPNAHLVINSNGKAAWSRGRPDRKNPAHFTQDKIIHLLVFLLNNDYVEAYGQVFRSVKGCPMGGNASGIICSLVAYFAERHPYQRLRLVHPSAQLFRFADDAFHTTTKWLFELYFAGPYKAAGFTLEHDEPEGETGAINFLESTIHLRPTKSLLPIAPTHYNRRTPLSRTERIYPHRGGCTSVRSQRTQVTNYARNLYHNTDSPRVFIERLVASHRRHPEYSLREVSTSALKVLNNTTRNRFLLSPRHLLHLAKCIQHGRTQYTPSLAYTHFLKPYK